MPPVQDQPVIVSKIVDECPGVKTFRLELPEGKSFPFVPGQFVMVAFPGDPKTKRAYSIASSPLDKGYVEITLDRVADFTARLFALKGGENLLLSGPHGSWLYRDEIKHAVLLSGGTGITPFRSMIRYVLGKGLPNRITLIYSVRAPSDVIYRQELAEFERKGVSVHLAGERFGIDALRAAVPLLSEATYYLCGPNHLVESLKKTLSGAGVGSRQILHEKWGDY